jgi:acid phosphatase class B
MNGLELPGIDNTPKQIIEGDQQSIPAETSQSGVNLILGEDSIEDIDGFKEGRTEAVNKTLEAEKIFQIQSDLGLNFVEDKDNSVTRLITLEDREREDLNKYQEGQRSQ